MPLKAPAKASDCKTENDNPVNKKTEPRSNDFGSAFAYYEIYLMCRIKKCYMAYFTPIGRISVENIFNQQVSYLS